MVFDRCLVNHWVLILTSLFASGSLWAQTHEDNTVQNANVVLNEIMAVPNSSIPQSMLKDAYAVAIIPKVLKGSFVIGARHGNGVLSVRDANGSWHAPIFVTLTGGNIGWQVGVQSTDVVLVFKSAQSVNGLLSGKFTLGADAAVAAGPVGRQAAAATDGKLSAEIYSWSRSRGLFVGVSFDGSVIEVDQLANARYYRQPTADSPVIVPNAAQQLTAEIARYTGVPNTGVLTQNASAATNPAAQNPNSPIFAQQHSRDETSHVRDELARFARELYKKLDPNWQSYLGLPAEVFNGNGHPSVAALNESLARFEAVRNDANYAMLSNDAEFQSTYGLLKHYTNELANSNQALNLPAPPIR